MCNDYNPRAVCADFVGFLVCCSALCCVVYWFGVWSVVKLSEKKYTFFTLQHSTLQLQYKLTKIQWTHEEWDVLDGVIDEMGYDDLWVLCTNYYIHKHFNCTSLFHSCKIHFQDSLVLDMNAMFLFILFSSLHHFISFYAGCFWLGWLDFEYVVWWWLRRALRYVRAGNVRYGTECLYSVAKILFFNC